VILSGWKAIAQHMGSSIRTAQRWERNGLPVKRPVPGLRSHVAAVSTELESWLDHGMSWRNHSAPGIIKCSRELRQKNHKLRQQNRDKMQNLRLRVEALQNEIAAIRAKRTVPRYSR